MKKYERRTPGGILKKFGSGKTDGAPPFEPPVIIRKRKIEEYYRCAKDGVFASIFGCDTKARYCSSNCVCDEVCKDISCSADCVPNCACDSHCSDCIDCHDCDDRGCYMDKPECWGHCLNDWE